MIESTSYADCQNGYDYFRRMDTFSGTPAEIADKQAKLRASFHAFNASVKKTNG